MVDILKELSQCNFAQSYEIAAHRSVILAGDPADQLIVLSSGLAKIYSERNIFLGLANPGSILGYEVLTPEMSYRYSVHTVTPCTLFSVSRGQNLENAFKNPELTLAVLAKQSQVLIQIYQRSSEIKVRKEIKRKLAYTIITLTEQLESKVILGVTNRDYANLIDTSRETVHRTLKAFREKGVVSTRKERVELLNPAGIAEIASIRPA